MIVMSTPVYESVRVAALEGIPAATGYPPHHPDIYRQLCSEFGHDPRTGERLAPQQWQAWQALRLPTSGTHRAPSPRAPIFGGARRPRAGRRARPALAARKTDVRLATQRRHVVAPGGDHGGEPGAGASGPELRLRGPRPPRRNPGGRELMRQECRCLALHWQCTGSADHRPVRERPDRPSRPLTQNAVRWFGLRRRSGRATVTGYSDWGTRAAPVNSSCLVTTLAAASV